MLYTQSNTEVSNSQTITDGVILDGTNIKLTNTGAGRIFGGLVFAQAGNTLINQSGGMLRVSDGQPATAVAITGSAGADIVINSGTIFGAIVLGAGSDTFIQRNGARVDLNLGADNDLFRFESGGSDFAANGGDGYDTVVLASGFSPTHGTDIVGFERLIVESDIIVDDYSGYQAIEFNNLGQTVYVSDSQNPLVDLRLSDQGVDLANASTLRSITGSDRNEFVALSSGSAVSGAIRLSGGNDQFNLFYRPDFPDAVFTSVDGGTGFDVLQMGLRGAITRQLDLSKTTGFERLDIYTQDEPSTVTLAGLSNFSRIDLEGAIDLTISNSRLSGTIFTISSGSDDIATRQSITLGAGSVIGSVIATPFSDAQLDFPTLGAASGTTLINKGQIQGDVSFYFGDDTYDGRDGLVGGLVDGGAGNDKLTGGSRSDILDGGIGNDTIAAGGGNDVVRLNGGSDFISGGTGTDALELENAISDYQLLVANERTILVGSEGAADVTGMEQIRFGHGELGLWLDGLASVERFDGLSYIASQSDLRAIFGLDTARGVSHFLSNGFAEGRTVTFNALAYLASYSDLQAAYGVNELAAKQHYITTGANEGRQNSFSGLSYIASYSDLRQAFGADANAGALHFLQEGVKEERVVIFDSYGYLSLNKSVLLDVGADTEAAAEHYITVGADLGLETTFDALRYTASYSDLIRAFGFNEVASRNHFIIAGINESRTASFEGLSYIASYSDLIQNLGANERAGIQHFIQMSEEEHRSVSFDPQRYAAANPDVAAVFGSDRGALTTHYILYGFAEGRSSGAAQNARLGEPELADPAFGNASVEFLQSDMASYQHAPSDFMM